MNNIVEPADISMDVYEDVSMNDPVDDVVMDEDVSMNDPVDDVVMDDVVMDDDVIVDDDVVIDDDVVMDDGVVMDENGPDVDYDDLVVKKGTVRYKFVIIIFLLSITLFHPESFKFTKSFFSNINVNVLHLIHSSLFAIIIYLMLKYSDNSLIFSPCNI